MFGVNRFTVLAVALFCVGWVGQVRAQTVLDQSNVVPTFSADLAVVTSFSYAQTFTVGVEGVLAQVGVQVYKTSGAVGDLVFDVRTAPNGVPNPADQQSLFRTVIPLAVIPTIDDPFTLVPLTSVDVSLAQIAVTPGDVLAVSLSRTGPAAPPWVLWRFGPPVYQGGGSFTRSGAPEQWRPLPQYDAGFQTLVIVPEPSSLVLCVAGVLGLWLLRWRVREGLAVSLERLPDQRCS